MKRIKKYVLATPDVHYMGLSRLGESRVLNSLPLLDSKMREVRDLVYFIKAISS